MNDQAAMMHAGPPPDMLDAVFLRRLAPPRETAIHQREARPENVGLSEATEAPLPATASGLAEGVDQPLVEWLLQEAPAQWAAVAEKVEQAVADGVRVIAVAGGARGEGRTALVAGLAATLQARGQRAIVVAGSLAGAGETLVEKGRDDGVVIVDAGIWFPPGPIRHDRLATLSAGCDAVILVRRAAQPPSPARAAAIEQTGCRLLGEVLMFEEVRHAVA